MNNLMKNAADGIGLRRCGGTFQQSECLRPKFLEPVETAFLELIHFVEIDGRRLLAAQAEL